MQEDEKRDRGEGEGYRPTGLSFDDGTNLARNTRQQRRER